MFIIVWCGLGKCFSLVSIVEKKRIIKTGFSLVSIVEKENTKEESKQCGLTVQNQLRYSKGKEENITPKYSLLTFFWQLH